MLANERPIGEFVTQLGTACKSKAQRSGVRAERIVRLLHILLQIRALRLDAVVGQAPIIPGPAIMAAEINRREVIGRGVRTQLIALIHGGPKIPRLGFIGETIGVAQTRCEDAERFLFGEDFEHIGAIFFGLQAVFANVAIGPDRHEQCLLVRRGNDVTRPVIVRHARGQRHNLLALGGDLRIAFLIGEGQQGISVGDVERVADQFHAVGRIEAVLRCQ